MIKEGRSENIMDDNKKVNDEKQNTTFYEVDGLNFKIGVVGMKSSLKPIKLNKIPPVITANVTKMDADQINNFLEAIAKLNKDFASIVLKLMKRLEKILPWIQERCNEQKQKSNQVYKDHIHAVFQNQRKRKSYNSIRLYNRQNYRIRNTCHKGKNYVRHTEREQAKEM